MVLSLTSGCKIKLNKVFTKFAKRCHDNFYFINTTGGFCFDYAVDGVKKTTNGFLKMSIKIR